MRRIIIFDDGPGSDDSWILVIIFGLYIICSIAIWPVFVNVYNASENSEERENLMLFATILLISCICISLIYIVTLMYQVSKGNKGLCDITFSKAYWVVCSSTTIVTSVICMMKDSHLIVTGEGMFTTCLIVFLCSGLPSFFAACICVSWRESYWRKSTKEKK